ncbi:MAG TPA: nuclear transport factor 2 family protein [Caulobacteraceae bacterium]|jgi:ketosteroid isomerase-like protein
MTMIALRAVGVAILLAALASPAGAAPDATASRIAKLEQQVNAAYAANNLPAYFAFYADDLRAMFPPEAPTTLPAYKAEWSAFIKSGGGIVSFKYSDMHIQVSPSGDAAVASYQAVASTRTPGKGVSAESFDETDVWFKRDNVWKIVEVHYSDNTPAKP